jgi:LmbE family N-acetylglucosaminyl deacetylase
VVTDVPGPAARSDQFTLVSLHAHPDDEALFTGGLLARCASEGHRTVVVVATDGERGLADEADRVDLGARRVRELHASAAALGVARLVTLGYGDSGFDAPEVPPPGSLCAARVEDVAERVAAILREERADVLTVYDPHGGYGHRDHARVRAVGVEAARLAATPVVLEATVSREALQRGVRLLGRLGVRPGGMSASAFDRAFRPIREITHEVDVRPWVRAKRAALAAHASQTAGGSGLRTVRLLSRLPMPLARLVLGREWFVEIGRSVTTPRLDDVFESLR